MLHKVTLSTSGKVFYIRKPTMKDHRIATQQVKMKGEAPTPMDTLEEMLSLLIVKVDHKNSNGPIEVTPPYKFDQLDYEEFIELMSAVNEESIIIDLKKKATVEKVLLENSSPSPTSK